jgi:hypothetical protein
MPPAAAAYVVEREARNAGSFLRKEPEDRSEKSVADMNHHQALMGPRLFCEKPLSSVAFGDTSFLRKEVLALRSAALDTQRYLYSSLRRSDTAAL